MTDFPRSYYVLSHLSVGLNVAAGLFYVALAVTGRTPSGWWYAALAPGWIAFAAWRLVARAHFRRQERDFAEKMAEFEAEFERIMGRRLQ